jgi:HD-GYP domain-containing protein (c-di-GMP phosphodiesterase class II)
MADALSLPARILAVADVFDALSAKRPYRDALPIEELFP